METIYKYRLKPMRMLKIVGMVVAVTWCTQCVVPV